MFWYFFDIWVLVDILRKTTSLENRFLELAQIGRLLSKRYNIKKSVLHESYIFFFSPVQILQDVWFFYTLASIPNNQSQY